MAKDIRVYVIEFGDRPTFQLQWQDPITQKTRTKTTQIRRSGLAKDRKLAERAAAELEKQLAAGEAVIPSKFGWDEFRKRYEAEVIPGLAPRTGEKIRSVLDKLENVISPRLLWDIDEKRLSAHAARLRAGDPDMDVKSLAESTIAGHLAHLKAALNWAVEQKLLPQLPAFPRTRRAKMSRGEKVMRGRPITLEEFERMLKAVPDVVGKAASAQWRFYLHGLWTSGLRLAESLELYWDDDSKLHPVLDGRFPMLRIPGDLEKGHKDRLLPITPDFARLLKSVPPKDRTGPVFRPTRRDGKPGRPAVEPVSKAIGKIGERAKVKVDSDKTASAHDLRRSFGERWAAKLMPAQLMELMRHESIDTTMKYYVGRNAERTAAILWEVDRAASPSASRRQRRNSPGKRAAE
jgi:integrase